MENYKAANQSHEPVNALNTDFLAYRVLNVKRVQHEVRKIYNQRARLRRETIN